MLQRPCVRVIQNAGAFIRLDLVAFHNPLNCRLTIDNIVICHFRDIDHADMVIIQNGAFVILTACPS